MSLLEQVLENAREFKHDTRKYGPLVGLVYSTGFQVFGSLMRMPSWHIPDGDKKLYLVRTEVTEKGSSKSSWLDHFVTTDGLVAVQVQAVETETRIQVPFLTIK